MIEHHPGDEVAFAIRDARRGAELGFDAFADHRRAGRDQSPQLLFAGVVPGRVSGKHRVAAQGEGRQAQQDPEWLGSPAETGMPSAA